MKALYMVIITLLHHNVAIRGHSYLQVQDNNVHGDNYLLVHDGIVYGGNYYVVKKGSVHMWCYTW